jgi:hypothetical protein
MQPSEIIVDALHKQGVAIEDAVLTALMKSPAELKSEGFTAVRLKMESLEYSLESLREGGYTAAELRKAQYAVSGRLFKMAGYSVSDLLNAEYSLHELYEIGYTLSEIKTGLEHRHKGVVARQTVDPVLWSIHKICNDLPTLKGLGFSALKLKQLGYMLSDLLEDFTITEAKDAGYRVQDFVEAGFGLKELKEEGFTARQMAEDGFSAMELLGIGYKVGDIREAGYTDEELRASGGKWLQAQHYLHRQPGR